MKRLYINTIPVLDVWRVYMENAKEQYLQEGTTFVVLGVCGDGVMLEPAKPTCDEIKPYPQSFRLEVLEMAFREVTASDIK